MNTQASKLIEVAKSFDGYLEKASNAQLDDFTANAGSANYTLFGAWYGLNGQAWCAIFISYCAASAHISTTIIPKFAYCPDGVNWFKAAGRWYARAGYTPQTGDIIYFTEDGSTACHVGIVTGADAAYVYTIEGNTSGSAALVPNGGAVCAKSHGLTSTYILGYGNPAYAAGETEGTSTMNIVTGETPDEVSLIKGIQKAIGANVDGQIGLQTLSDIACKLGAANFPGTYKIYGVPVIIANDIIIKPSPGTGLAAYANSMNGSFFYAGKPCAICVFDGVTYCSAACHSGDGYPESVLYKLRDGAIGLARIKSTSELPGNLMWAAGGLGLLSNYNPDAEGFKQLASGDYSDVLRCTNHAMLGVKNGHVYMVYCPSMTAAQVNALAGTLGLEKAIMCDGGSIAGMNGGESFAKINTGVTQYYLIQGV